MSAPKRVPWRDRSGRFSPLKTGVLALLPLPAIAAFVGLDGEGAAGQPIDVLLHASGFWADGLVILVLAVTPWASIFAASRLVLVRRMMGIAAALYVAAHLGVYIVQQHFAWGFIGREAFTVPVLLLGTAAVAGLALLVATSTDASVRRLGRNWKRLHLLVHPIIVSALVHSFMEAKLDVSLAATFAGCYLWLVLWRLMPRPRKRDLLSLLLLTIVATLGTALIEWAWYAFATGLPADRVAAANLSLAAGIRPAQWVAIAGLAIVLAAGLHRLLRQRRAPFRFARLASTR